MGRMRNSWGERVRRSILKQERGSYIVLGFFIILAALESYMASLFSANPDSEAQTGIARAALVILGELHFLVALCWPRINNRHAFLKLTFLAGVLVVVPLMVVAHAASFSCFVIVLLAWASYVGLGQRRRGRGAEAPPPAETESSTPEYP